jgi:hypothetical protein
VDPSLLLLRPLTVLFFQTMILELLVNCIISKGNFRTRRKPAPVPLCPPQLPHEMIQAQTRAAAVGSRRISARVTGPTSVYMIIGCVVADQNDLSPHKPWELGFGFIFKCQYTRAPCLCCAVRAEAMRGAGPWSKVC